MIKCWIRVKGKKSMSEEEKREAISNIRYLYGLTYDIDAELREKMQEKINYLERFISNLLDLYNKEKEKNRELLEGQTKTLEKLLIPELLEKYVSKDRLKEILKENTEYGVYLKITELLEEE